ncbi:MAG: choline BCCT transporter BetT [Actinomycetaceae bacterium]|nr:choline BCCT transporter BetT [Actinomycetaceae bacterium]
MRSPARSNDESSEPEAVTETKGRQAETGPAGAETGGGHAQRLNPVVFFSSAIVIAIVAGLAIIAPKRVEAIFDHAVSWAGRWFGSFYILLITAVLIFVVILALSRFGRVRLGPDDSTPDFSTFSWAAMLFAAGIGTGIMFFAVAEPIAQYAAPPTGDAQTIEAARSGVVLAIFHYGISGWGLYALVGMSMAYFAYRRHHPLAVRSTLRPLIGDRVDGWVGNAMDTAALVGGVFGIAASLGVGVVQLNVALNILFSLPQGAGAQIGLIILSVVMATVSAVSGVDRGVRILSNVNVVLAIALALWVMVTGRTAFLMDALVGSVGDFITQFPGLTLETYAYERPDQWLNDWTLFFWAWWITWAAFVGMFLARISRGRTIREFLLGALILPFSYVVMWMAIFGNHALDIVRSGDKDFMDTVVDKPEQGLYMLLDRLPGSTGLIAIALFIGVLFYVTSADSGALVMANLSTRNDGKHRDAPPWLRIFWACLTGVLTVAMLQAGGVRILQKATILMALPFSVAIIAIAVALLKALRVEDSRARAPGVVDRNRMLEQTASAAGLKRASWRDRLSRSFDIVSAERAWRAMDERIVPALQAVAEELRKEHLSARVDVEGEADRDRGDALGFLGRATLTLEVPGLAGVGGGSDGVYGGDGGHGPGPRSFTYVVRMVQVPARSYGSLLNEADDITVRLEVRPRSGGQGYDIMDWSANQVAHDVLDHYEQWLESRR